MLDLDTHECNNLFLQRMKLINHQTNQKTCWYRLKLSFYWMNKKFKHEVKGNLNWDSRNVTSHTAKIEIIRMPNASMWRHKTEQRFIDQHSVKNPPTWPKPATSLQHYKPGPQAPVPLPDSPLEVGTCVATAIRAISASSLTSMVGGKQAERDARSLLQSRAQLWLPALLCTVLSLQMGERESEGGRRESHFLRREGAGSQHERRGGQGGSSSEFSMETSSIVNLLAGNQGESLRGILPPPTPSPPFLFLFTNFS